MFSKMPLETLTLFAIALNTEGDIPFCGEINMEICGHYSIKE